MYIKQIIYMNYLNAFLNETGDNIMECNVKSRMTAATRIIRRFFIYAAIAAMLLANFSGPAFATGSAGGTGDAHFIRAERAPVAIGNDYTLAIKSDGSLWAQGGNWLGQLGDDTRVTRYAPVKVMDNVVSVAAAELCSHAIKGDGSLWAWGDNKYGQIGDGTVTVYAYNDKRDYVIAADNDKPKPVKIMDNVASVTAGTYHTLAVKTDGSLWAWGDNHHGQIGDGTITECDVFWDDLLVDNNRLLPVKIMDDVVFAAAGSYSSFAIKTDGSLWAWGAYLIGESYGTATSPRKVMDDVVTLSAAHQHGLVIKKDGSLWVFGSNPDGPIDDGTVSIVVNGNDVIAFNTLMPINIIGFSTRVSAGTWHNLAIGSENDLWAWGDNTYGQLCNGKYTKRGGDYNIILDNNEPTPIKVMDDAVYAAAGHDCSLALKTDGSLWGWGSNLFSADSREMGDAYYIMGNVIMPSIDYIPIKPIDADSPAIWDEPARPTVTDRSFEPAPSTGSAGPGGPGGPVASADPAATPKPNASAKPSASAKPAKMAKPKKAIDPAQSTNHKKSAETAQPDNPAAQDIPVANAAFIDVPVNHWAYSNIAALVKKGVISGYPDGSFKPDGLVTRSEFAKMMTLALGMPQVSNPVQSFADVNAGDWEFIAVETAKKYLTGYKQGDSYYFKGGEPAVREDMAVALVKALGLETELPDPVNAGYADEYLRKIFGDVDDISPNLRSYVMVAYDFKLINGYPDSSFKPQNSITRAEAASLLTKVLASEAMEKVTFD